MKKPSLYADSSIQPTSESTRIASLDVLRGFALLGILLLNIVGMGMLSSAYFNPLGGLAGVTASQIDVAVALLNELFTEGAMRALFSLLFGAGVVLFTASRSGALHYRRTFWLLCFGLFDAYLLLWSGDILVVYALGGALLYWVRDVTPKRLIVAAVVVMAMLGLIRVGSVVGLNYLQAEYAAIVEVEGPQTSDVATTSKESTPELTQEQQETIEGWLDFKVGAYLSADQQAIELAARTTSYSSAAAWAKVAFNDAMRTTLPIFMLWDALAMMLLGMALYKMGVLQGAQSREFYLRLALSGFFVGLSVNGFEVWRSVASNFDLVVSFSFLQPTYDLGRVGMALGYVGLVIWWCKGAVLAGLRKRLAAVGRMALTNYLMHSFIALLLFSGAGFGLVGTLERWMLYPIVLLIWLFQLWFSSWWLARFAQGPLEAVWRRLTYGVR